jgi:hypothetical protein
VEHPLRPNHGVEAYSTFFGRSMVKLLLELVVFD